MGVEAARHGVSDLDTGSAGTTIPAPLGSVTTSEAFLTTPNGTYDLESELALLHPSWRSSQNYCSTVTSGPWLVSSPASQAEMAALGSPRPPFRQ